MNRRDFGKLAALGTLAAGPRAGAEAETASYQGLGRRPMKWAIRHSMQIANLQPATLQLASQLGMEYVNIWSGPNRYQEIVRTVAAAGLKVAKIGNGAVHN